MAFDVNKAHEISSDGLFIEDGFHLVGGALSPTVAYPSPTSPALYVQENGSLWKYPLGGPSWVLFKNGSFSYHRIAESITIDSGQHMIAAGALEIESSGSLEILGDSCLVIEE